MPQPRIKRDVDGAAAALTARPRWSLAALAAVSLMLATVTLTAGASLGIQQWMWSMDAPPDCRISETQPDPRCFENLTTRHLRFEALLLGRRAAELAKLEPGLAMQPGPVRLELPDGSVADHVWQAQSEGNRRRVERLLTDRGLYQRSKTQFQPTRVRESRYVGSLVDDYTVRDDGAHFPLSADHPSAVLAGRRALDDVDGSRDALNQVLGAWRIDQTLGWLSQGPAAALGVTRRAWAWVLTLAGGLLLGLGVVGLFATFARRRHRIVVDGAGVLLDRRRLRWDDILTTDLAWRRPSVQLRSGECVQLESLNLGDAGVELQLMAERRLSLRREQAATASREGGLSPVQEAERVLAAARSRR